MPRQVAPAYHKAGWVLAFGMFKVWVKTASQRSHNFWQIPTQLFRCSTQQLSAQIHRIDEWMEPDWTRRDGFRGFSDVFQLHTSQHLTLRRFPSSRAAEVCLSPQRYQQAVNRIQCMTVYSNTDTVILSCSTGTLSDAIGGKILLAPKPHFLQCPFPFVLVL